MVKLHNGWTENCSWTVVLLQSLTGSSGADFTLGGSLGPLARPLSLKLLLILKDEEIQDQDQS